MVKNTYGTGCFVVLNTGSELQRSSCGLLSTVCCDANGGAAYALEGSIFTTGAAIQWLRDEMGLIGSAVETEDVAARVQDTQGVYVVPAFAGLGAPYWDMDARGAIVGLTRGTGREQIIRATLDSIAYQTRDVVDAMNCDGSATVHELRADGGAAANNRLMPRVSLMSNGSMRAGAMSTRRGGPGFTWAMQTHKRRGVAKVNGVAIGAFKVAKPAEKPATMVVSYGHTADHPAHCDADGHGCQGCRSQPSYPVGVQHLANAHDAGLQHHGRCQIPDGPVKPSPGRS